MSVKTQQIFPAIEIAGWRAKANCPPSWTNIVVRAGGQSAAGYPAAILIAGKIIAISIAGLLIVIIPSILQLLFNRTPRMMLFLIAHVIDNFRQIPTAHR